MCKNSLPFFLTVTAVFVGCNAPADTRVLEPFIAVAGGYSLLGVTPDAPPPVVGDVCDACFGRGIVGDGKSMTKCLKCDGTGKKKKTAAAPAVVAAPICKDGKCQIPRSTLR